MKNNTGNLRTELDHTMETNFQLLEYINQCYWRHRKVGSFEAHETSGTHRVFIEQCCSRESTGGWYLYSSWILRTLSVKPQEEEEQRESWVPFNGTRLFNRLSSSFDRNVHHRPVCKALAESKCPWRLFYYFSENTLLSVVTKMLLLHLHNILWSLKKLQLASLCHGMRPAVQTQRSVSETESVGPWEG